MNAVEQNLRDSEWFRAEIATHLEQGMVNKRSGVRHYQRRGPHIKIKVTGR